MKVYGLWYGGSSYSVGGYEDIEEFDSLADAKYVFDGRARNGYWKDYGTGLTPCVDSDTCKMWLWFKVKPEDNGDLYPDDTLEFGPRGGVRRGGA